MKQNRGKGFHKWCHHFWRGHLWCTYRCKNRWHGERLGGVRTKVQNSNFLEKLMPSFMDNPIGIYFLSTTCLTKKVGLLRTAGRGRSNYLRDHRRTFAPGNSQNSYCLVVADFFSPKRLASHVVCHFFLHNNLEDLR